MFVITGLDRAGAETQVKDLTIELISCGHFVEIVTLTAPIAFVEELSAAGARVVNLGMSRDRKNPINFLKAVLKLRKFVRTFQPDIVHSHMVHANLLSRVALGWSIGSPLICTAHNTTEGGSLRDWAYRLTNWASDLDTTVSEAATDRFLQKKVFRKSKTITMYNGINMRVYDTIGLHKSSEGSNFRWLAIGRLQVQKDYPTLFAALKHVPSATLDIAGRGELLFSLSGLASTYGIENRVSFLGLREDIPALLQNYDGYVMSSAWEGFGLALAEAMASGLPVVSTRSGGPQEILGEDQLAGFLVPPKDPVSLADAMRRVMGMDASDRAAMGGAGRLRVAEKFGMQAILEQWLEVYRHLIEKRGSP